MSSAARKAIVGLQSKGIQQSTEHHPVADSLAYAQTWRIGLQACIDGWASARSARQTRTSSSNGAMPTKPQLPSGTAVHLLCPQGMKRHRCERDETAREARLLAQSRLGAAVSLAPL